MWYRISRYDPVTASLTGSCGGCRLVIVVARLRWAQIRATELLAGSFDGEHPRDASPHGISLTLPGSDLGDERRLVANSSVETLSDHYSNFDIDHAVPDRRLGRVFPRASTVARTNQNLCDGALGGISACRSMDLRESGLAPCTLYSSMNNLRLWLELALLLIFLPFIAVRKLGRVILARWTVSRALKGVRNLGVVESGRFEEGVLVLRGVMGVDGGVWIVRPRGVVAYHLEGDGGFADANSLTYLFVVETSDGDHPLSWQMTFQGAASFDEMTALFDGLRTAAILQREIVLRDAIGGGSVIAALPVWLLLFALIWSVVRSLW